MAHRKVPPVAPQCPLDHQKILKGAAEASDLREFFRPTTGHLNPPRVDGMTLFSSSGDELGIDKWEPASSIAMLRALFHPWPRAHCPA